MAREAKNKNKKRATIDVDPKTYKKVRTDAFKRDMTPKEIMQEIVEGHYK